MNNQIKAEIIKDSINPNGRRITTFILEFPRMILAELNTHRVFSKNSASSRAIPFNKVIKSVRENGFRPIAFQTHHKGMQGNEYLLGHDNWLTFEAWEEASQTAIRSASILHALGVTKQLCNRILEPFMMHRVLLTATEFDNFFDLRCPKYFAEKENKYYKSRKEWVNNYYNPTFHTNKTVGDFSIYEWLKLNHGQAEIHMMDLAEHMYDALQESKPEPLKFGEWHIPFSDRLPSLDEWLDYRGINRHFRKDYIPEWLENRLKIATARCARVSYQTVGDNPTIDYVKDIALYDSLKESKHWSPFEHIARATNALEYISNFKGYSQLRHVLTDKN